MVGRARITPAHAASRVTSWCGGCRARSLEKNTNEALWRHLERPPAVQMFGRDVCGDATYLYLEHTASFSLWPWSDTALSAL